MQPPVHSANNRGVNKEVIRGVNTVLNVFIGGEEVAQWLAPRI